MGVKRSDFDGFEERRKKNGAIQAQPLTVTERKVLSQEYPLRYRFIVSAVIFFLGPDLGENVRAGCRDARVQSVEGLVFTGAAERAHGKVSLSGDMPLSRYEHTR